MNGNSARCLKGLICQCRHVSVPVAGGLLGPGGLIKHQGRQRYPAAAFDENCDLFRT